MGGGIVGGTEDTHGTKAQQLEEMFHTTKETAVILQDNANYDIEMMNALAASHCYTSPLLGRSADKTRCQARGLWRVEEQFLNDRDPSLHRCMVEGREARIVSLPAVTPFGCTNQGQQSEGVATGYSLLTSHDEHSCLLLEILRKGPYFSPMLRRYATASVCPSCAANMSGVRPPLLPCMRNLVRSC